MPTFTCITESQNNIHLSQHMVDSQTEALREHVAAMPSSDATGPFDKELEWLHQITGDSIEVQLHPVGHCKNTWLWLDGARHEPQYLTYVVKTDIRD